MVEFLIIIPIVLLVFLLQCIEMNLPHNVVLFHLAPPMTSIQARRIHFYERHGFTVYKNDYMQPSYRKGGTGCKLVVCFDTTIPAIAPFGITATVMFFLLYNVGRFHWSALSQITLRGNYIRNWVSKLLLNIRGYMEFRAIKCIKGSACIDDGSCSGKLKPTIMTGMIFFFCSMACSISSLNKHNGFVCSFSRSENQESNSTYL